MASFQIKNRTTLWVGSAEYVAGELMLTAEYARSTSKQHSDRPELSPPIDVTSERAYAMASFRVAPWLQPGAYYSVLFPDVDHRAGRENRQHDIAATLRFDINAYWLVKAEGHYLAGTAGLLNPLRINPPDISTAARYWSAFFLKTTVHF